MTSDNPSTPKIPEPDHARDDLDRTKDRVREEAHSAKAEARKAADSVRDTASDLSNKAREKAQEQGEKGKEQVAGGLEDFAAAVRKASEELGSRDQSMASNLVREVAGGLEQASRTIHGKDIGELTQSVARFARERPATFLVGAALAGLALGRFARSSGEHDERDYAGDERGSLNARTNDRYRFKPGSVDRSGGAGDGPVPTGYRSSYSEQPRPTESAFPNGRDPVTGTSRGPTDRASHEPAASTRESSAFVKHDSSPASFTTSPSASTATTMPGGNDER